MRTSGGTGLSRPQSLGFDNFATDDPEVLFELVDELKTAEKQMATGGA